MVLRKNLSTTASLLRSLDAILYEITKMEEAVRDAPYNEVADADRRQVRQDLHELRRRADSLMEWLSLARLEELKH